MGKRALAVPRGLEPPTFGLGKRCLCPKQCLLLPSRSDLSTFFGIAIPARAGICHPIPDNWVAIWVATFLFKPSYIKASRASISPGPPAY